MPMGTLPLVSSAPRLAVRPAGLDGSLRKQLAEKFFPRVRSRNLRKDIGVFAKVFLSRVEQIPVRHVLHVSEDLGTIIHEVRDPESAAHLRLFPPISAEPQVLPGDPRDLREPVMIEPFSGLALDTQAAPRHDVHAVPESFVHETSESCERAVHRASPE